MDNAQLQPTEQLYRFGAFRLDAAERRLWREEEPLALMPKQFDLLFYFVQNAGRLVKKSELLEAVWGNVYVEETTLARNVSWLRKLLADDVNGARIIETVPKLGYRFTVQVTRAETDADAFIIEEQTVQYWRGEETITIDDVPASAARDETVAEEWGQTASLPQNVPLPRRSSSAVTFLLTALACVALTASGYVIYRNYFKNEPKGQPGGVIDASTAGEYQDGTRSPVSEKAPIKVGSIVHLRNQDANDAGYLDAWGRVRDKPEFSQVPTEIMFVATHPNPNRDNGSGSWEIVSATGKRAGVPLLYGDKIHLRNMYPEAGYLDNCGWLKDMPVYKKFVKAEKFAVFTAYSEDRDNGTGTWIVGSDTKFAGRPVLAEDDIVLENGFPGGGFLNTAGRVNDIPAFQDYDGARLVFIQEATTSRHPDSGLWLISLNSQSHAK